MGQFCERFIFSVLLELLNDFLKKTLFKVQTQIFSSDNVYKKPKRKEKKCSSREQRK